MKKFRFFLFILTRIFFNGYKFLLCLSTYVTETCSVKQYGDPNWNYDGDEIEYFGRDFLLSCFTKYVSLDLQQQNTNQTQIP